MAIGIKRLRQIQLGAESTPGTPVTCTTVWRGMGALEDGLELAEQDIDIGLIVGSDLTYIPKLYGKLAMDSVLATFEQAPYLFEAGVKKVGTGAADGVGSGKIYDYPIATTAVPTLQTYTVKGGDNAGAEVMEYAVTEQITLEGSGEDAIKMSANWFGRQIATTTFDSVSIPTVEGIIAAKGALFIDAIGGTPGTTQVSNVLLDWKLTIDTGAMAVFTADNEALYFATVKVGVPQITLEVTFEHDTDPIAEKANWRNQVKRLIQLKVEGTALATPGTAYTYKTFIANLPGYWSQFAALSDNNGNDVIKGTFISRYNATYGAGPNFIFVNELSALP